MCRRQLGKELGLQQPNSHNMLWVTEFPLVEWDEEGGRWESLHHPFTCPNPKDVITSEATWGLDRARAMAYDVVYNGVELGGGSLRIYR